MRIRVPVFDSESHMKRWWLLRGYMETDMWEQSIRILTEEGRKAIVKEREETKNYDGVFHQIKQHLASGAITITTFKDLMDETPLPEFFDISFSPNGSFVYDKLQWLSLKTKHVSKPEKCPLCNFSDIPNFMLITQKDDELFKTGRYVLCIHPRLDKTKPELLIARPRTSEESRVEPDITNF